MKTIKLLSIAVLISTTSVVFAQKTKVKKGDFTELKGQTEVNVAWDYADAQARGGGPFAKWKAQPESDWVKAIVDRKNQNEAGKGDNWKSRWEAAKSESFPTEFETKMAKIWDGCSVKQGLEDAKYTLHIRVTYVDPGYSTGTGATDAFLSAIIEVRETGTENVTSSATMEMIKGSSGAKYIPGMAGKVAGGVEGATFEKRLGMSYEKMAKSLYNKVLKKAFK